ncbi:uncharacterized protein LOC125744737 [Brienomyrus brachyistius]|uniref:uncharacterized protein LOC125744737 n=1 Tax=Brienomyrus brachyistius TaxID=42636 RepID=UPI0020B31E94|nr:uncharacterized protein LOC125744737 [Brienomyrus brachyistius]
MAESKSLKQLKRERMTAKQRFSRLANSVMKSCKKMSADELMEAFNKVVLDADKVLEANEEVEIAWLEELEHVSTPKESMRDDIKRTVEECEQKLDDVEHFVQKVLWGNFGNSELTVALEAAEKECKRLSMSQPGLKLEVYELMLNHLEGLVKAAKEAVFRWSRWISDAERPDFQQRMRNIESLLPELISGKADLLQAKLEHNGSSDATLPPPPAIKLRPTALPRFDGNRRNFYLWKKEWEALQKQGEPTGSKETFSLPFPEKGLLAENDLKEFPVIMMILEVTANAGQKIGTLIDLASDTNYITHEAAAAAGYKEITSDYSDVEIANLGERR